MPGSGKTTHAKQVERSLRAVRFCPDEWMEELGMSLWDEEARARIEKLQWKFARDLLSLGHNVVIEWATWARAERDALRAGARALGAAAELHFLDAPIDVLLERTSARKMEPPITFNQIRRWAEIFERPSPEELALFDPRSTLEHAAS